MKAWVHLPCLTLDWCSLTKTKHQWFLLLYYKMDLHYPKQKKTINKSKTKTSRKGHKIRFTYANLCLNDVKKKPKNKKTQQQTKNATKKTNQKLTKKTQPKTPSVMKTVIKVAPVNISPAKRRQGCTFICVYDGRKKNYNYEYCARIHAK